MKKCTIFTLCDCYCFIIIIIVVLFLLAPFFWCDSLWKTSDFVVVNVTFWQQVTVYLTESHSLVLPSTLKLPVYFTFLFFSFLFFSHAESHTVPILLPKHTIIISSPETEHGHKQKSNWVETRTCLWDSDPIRRWESEERERKKKKQGFKTSCFKNAEKNEITFSFTEL